MNLKIVFPFFLIIFIGFAADEIYRPHETTKTPEKIEIVQGFGSRDIAELLKNSGIIRSKWAFVAYASLKGDASRLKSGFYEFERASVAEIIDRLIEGGENETIITIPEGWTGTAIAAYLEKNGIVPSENFTAFIARNAHFSLESQFSFLSDRPPLAGIEGYLFPDTYSFIRGSQPEQVVIKILENFDKKISSELRDEITRQKKSLFEIITMASLIEKEVRSDEDRAIVAGILWKRIEYDIPLQVDATITYITGKRTTKVSIEDIKIDSPYNTYKYKGLPAGPIANPGLSAIRAAIYPKESPFLFYLSTSDGVTVYSRTLEEHNRAKVKYLK